VGFSSTHRVFCGSRAARRSGDTRRRFSGSESLYKGTWHLEPKTDELKITMLRDDVAQLYVPIMFTIGPAGQTPAPMRFLMNQVLIKTPGGWQVASILPIPAPAP
jgi:hypothetical protein